MSLTHTLVALAALATGLLAQHDGFVVHRVALSPDATTAAFGRVTELGSGGVLLLQRAGEAEPRSLGRASIVRGITFAPDSNSVFRSDDRGAVHHVSVTGEELRTFELGRLPGFCNDVAVSADGARMVCVDGEKRLQVFSVHSGDRLWGQQLEEQALSAIFLPDGDLAVGDNVGAVTLWSPSGERRPQRFTIGSNAMRLAVDAVGRQLAVTAWNGAIAVFDLRTGARRDRPKTGQRIYAVAFSPDGNHLVTSSSGAVTIWHLNGDGDDERIEGEHTIGAVRFRISSDGGSAMLFGADYRGGIHELKRLAHRPYPQLVTAATRADADELARLRKPGKLLFADGFDSDESFAHYFEIQGKQQGRVAIATDAANVHTGKGSLRLTATANDGNSRGAGPVLWLGDDGHDIVHLRYWIRYADDYDQGNLHHTGGSLSGVAGDNKWGGMGKAGLRPTGDERFSTRVEGWRDWGRREPPGYLHCYTYWMDMKKGRDGNYWGNMLTPEIAAERIVPRRGVWQCVELRVQNNHLGKADGELAVWLDGELYVHYRGFRWRSAQGVRIKRVGLLCYVHEARRDNTVWFDDVVVSTGYVGPR